MLHLSPTRLNLMDTAISTPNTSTHGASKAINVSLWVAQSVLGFVFAFADFTKSFTPIQELALRMPWAAVLPEALVRFIGVSELAGGIGLLLPALTRVQPRLTPIAASGLVVIMVLAAAFDIMHGEYSAVPINVVLGGLAAFIAWGRFTRFQIQSR